MAETKDSYIPIPQPYLQPREWGDNPPPPLTDEEMEERLAYRLDRQRRGLPQDDIAFTWRLAEWDKWAERDAEHLREKFANERFGPRTPVEDTLSKLSTEPNKDIQAKPCWISPDGKLWHCGHCEHSFLADLLALKLFPDEFSVTPNGEHILEEKGFVKVTQDGAGDRTPILNSTRYILRPYPFSVRLVVEKLAEAFKSEGKPNFSSSLLKQLNIPD